METLRGISIKAPAFHFGKLPDELRSVNGYGQLQTFFPTLASINSTVGNVREEVWMDHKWRVVAMDVSGGTGPVKAVLQANPPTDSATRTSKQVFLKVTHLLDPIHWIRGEYSIPKDAALPGHHKTWSAAWEKLQDQGNQAYVESVASYALGRLAEEGVSPHFNEFYGSCCAKAATYRYNLTDDFYSYREDRWFWKGHKGDLFKLVVRNRKNPDEAVPEDISKFVFDSDIGSESGSELSGSGTGSESSEEELENITVEPVTRAGSIHSADSMSDVFYTKSDSESGSNSDTESDSSDILDTYDIHAEFADYPVMLILTEMNKGTMEDLLTDFEAVGASPGTYEWEERWTAWLFQIVAALACAQKIIGFTHNDLHTNNIVWIPTDEQYLYYRTGTGAKYRVPTYGKVFRIIDFGRAIFTINGRMFISDDFKEENDAGEQYAFSPLSKNFETEVPPNPSFDLCRLAVSLLSGLFPVKPIEIEDAATLSSEKGLVVKETMSELYNLLWSFMIDDKGRNVFMNPDESERFPDFDLYKHIAKSVHVAVPSAQIGKPLFTGYRIGAETDSASKKVYPLFT